jgi:hypothetical protein
MSNYRKQIGATGKENIEILSSVMPGSGLHQLVDNPVDSGIDEG